MEVEVKIKFPEGVKPPKGIMVVLDPKSIFQEPPSDEEVAEKIKKVAAMVGYPIPDTEPKNVTPMEYEKWHRDVARSSGVNILQGVPVPVGTNFEIGDVFPSGSTYEGGYIGGESSTLGRYYREGQTRDAPRAPLEKPETEAKPKPVSSNI